MFWYNYVSRHISYLKLIYIWKVSGLKGLPPYPGKITREALDWADSQIQIRLTANERK